MAFAEASGSGFHPVEIRGGERDHYNNPLWAIVLVVVFLVIIFFAMALFTRRDERPHHVERDHNNDWLAATMAMNMPRHHDDNHLWDIVRDENREFGNLKMEVKKTAWATQKEAEARQRDTDKYFYEQARLTDRNHYDALREMDTRFYALEKGQKESELRILDRIALDREKRLESENQRLYTENSNLRQNEYLSRPRAYAYDDCCGYGNRAYA